MSLIKKADNINALDLATPEERNILERALGGKYNDRGPIVGGNYPDKAFDDRAFADDALEQLDDIINSDSNDEFEKSDDYESCGDCGFDHGYEYEQAYKWHMDNPGSYFNSGVIPPNENELYVEEEDADLENDPLADYGVMSPEIIPQELDYDQDDFSSAKDKSKDKDSDDDTEVVISVTEGDDEPQIFKFDLPMIPGSDVEDEIEIEEPEEDVVVEERDMWDWNSLGLKNFLKWLQGMFDNIPKHSGHDTSGIERVIAFLSRIDKEISKAVRSDIRGEIDVNKVEEARHSIKDGIKRCEERLDKITGKSKKKKKKADSDNAIVKEAGATPINNVTATVPLFILRMAKICINGTVSAGHSIEDMFSRLVDKYKLDEREQAELLELIENMGYPVPRDRGFNVDERFDRTGENGFDWPANYYS